VSGGAGTAGGAVRHLVGDVQRLGLLSAVSVADRYADFVDRALGAVPGGGQGWPGDGAPRGEDEPRASQTDERPAPDAHAGDLQQLADAAGALAQTWLALLEATSGALAPSTPSEVAPGRVNLPATTAGEESFASVWLHNPTALDHACVRLQVTSLVSADGGCVQLGAVRLEPAVVPLLRAGASEPVRVCVSTARDQPPGVYHGLVVCSVAPDEPLPLTMRVAPVDQAPT
jgi:hypothetical protein